MTITDPRRTAGRTERAEERRRARRTRWLVLLGIGAVVAALFGGIVLTDNNSSAPSASSEPLPTVSAPRHRDGPLGARSGSWQLVMSDEFNGAALDPALWHTCYWWSERGCTNLGNKELEWYLPDNVHVDGGSAHLVARRESSVGADGLPFAYTSGLISQAGVDRDLFKFTYGFAEARVRIPAGSGLWSAFWMLPASRLSKPEMDIFEVVGEHPRRTVMHSHWQGGQDGDESIKRTFEGPDFSSGWHTFGLDWQPESLRFYVDGVVRWTVTDPNAIPHEPMYLLANLAVGGTFTAGVEPSTPFPSELALDYVKVWRAR